MKTQNANRVRSRVLQFTAVLVLTAVLSACDNSGDQSRLKVRLTDSPSELEALWVQILEVQAHVDNDWISLQTNSGVYNILEFTNGNSTVLCDQKVPSGQLTQLRFVLGTENSMSYDGNLYPLQIASSATSGLTFNVHQQLQAGESYELWVDFDAGRSIFQEGNGEWRLKPLLRAYFQSGNGSIKGVVIPPSMHPYIMAIKDSDTLGTYASGGGYFHVGGCAPGTYKLEFHVHGQQMISMPLITVTAGMSTNIGTVTLSP